MLLKLKESGLNEADAKLLNLQPHTDKSSEQLGLSRVGAGFKIPYYSAAGKLLTMYRYRYFSTEQQTGLTKGAKLRKYDQPKDTQAEIYLPRMLDWPAIMADPGSSLILTEGELKAACATKMGFPTVGLGGVFSFGAKHKLQKMLPSLAAFKWESRAVFIVYDSDAVTNANVLLAESRLAKVLSEMGAMVFIVRLPQEGGAKVGLDDYLMKHGAAALDKLLETTEPFAQCEALHALNQEVIYVKHPSMVVEYPKQNHPEDQPRYRMMRVGTFKDEVYATRSYMVQKGDGMMEKPAAPDWVKWPARSEVDSVVYAPGADRVVNSSQLNLWEGWGGEPVKGDVSLFLQLVDFVFKGADPLHKKWFLQWVAYPIQNPGVKMNAAVVVWSTDQGVGKSLLGYTIGRVYGKNYCEVGKQDLVGSFNSWQANKQFVLGDEITGGDSREVADRLKSIITAPTITVNKKFEPEYTIDNHCNYMFTSQHQDAFFMTDKDRRYFVHEVAEKAPAAFFKQFDKWYKTQAATNALFYYLLRVDLEGFNPMAEAPRTASRIEMIDASKSEHAAWIAELKEFPDNRLRVGDVVLPFSLYTTEDLLALYQPDDGAVRRRRPVSAKAFGIAMKEAGFKQACKGAAVDTLKGKKQRVWCVRNCEKFVGLAATTISERYIGERTGRGAAVRKFVREGK